MKKEEGDSILYLEAVQTIGDGLLYIYRSRINSE